MGISVGIPVGIPAEVDGGVEQNLHNGFLAAHVVAPGSDENLADAQNHGKQGNGDPQHVQHVIRR